ncbi:DUF2510 domain-containing protein [Leifsonia poae]|uniref:DUF2510 domain-containing protein n=1 Tax=Leifsonia poae TaxID=110933 RepID=UPI003D67C283
MTDTRLPEAGWFPDPAGSLGMRWWTGTGWSEHLRPFDAPVVAAPASAAVAAPVAPVATRAPVRVPDRGQLTTSSFHPGTQPIDTVVAPVFGGPLGPSLGNVGHGALRNVLAYRSVNFGATAAILFVFAVISADLAVHALPFVWVIFLSLVLVIVGSALAVTAAILAIIALCRVRTYRGLGPAITGLAFGIVFCFTFPLVRLTMQFLLTFLG